MWLPNSRIIGVLLSLFSALGTAIYQAASSVALDKADTETARSTLNRPLVIPCAQRRQKLHPVVCNSCASES